MHLRKRNEKTQYQTEKSWLGDTGNAGKVREEKDLSIWINNLLKPTNNAIHATNKAN